MTFSSIISSEKTANEWPFELNSSLQGKRRTESAEIWIWMASQKEGRKKEDGDSMIGCVQMAIGKSATHTRELCWSL